MDGKRTVRGSSTSRTTVSGLGYRPSPEATRAAAEGGREEAKREKALATKAFWVRW